MAHSKNRRPSLFSLSARMRRRARPVEVIIDFDRGDDGHVVDDDCPICVAAREGRPVSFDALHDPAYLIAEARRVLQRVKLAPGEEAEIVQTGRLLPDQTYEVCRYTVDRNGCIHLMRNETRTLVTRIPID
jgi:hypothetical protein